MLKSMKANKTARSNALYPRLGVGVVSLVLLISISITAGAQERDANSILKAMSDYVGAQQNIELLFDSSIEVITPELEKIQFTNSGGALLSRPDKLYAHRIGGYSDVEVYFDGKLVSVFGNHVNGYAQFDGPATLDQLFEALGAGHGIALPGADLLSTYSYDALIADVMEAKYIGHGVVNGNECEHLAFRNFDTDWQIWIQTGEQPIPRKLVITSKTLNSAPQYSVHIKEWKTDISPKPDAFTFVPPEGAQQLSPDMLIEFDELPQGAPVGVNQ